MDGTRFSLRYSAGAGEAERYDLARAVDLHHGDACAGGSQQKQGWYRGAGRWGMQELHSVKLFSKRTTFHRLSHVDGVCWIKTSGCGVLGFSWFRSTSCKALVLLYPYVLRGYSVWPSLTEFFYRICYSKVHFVAYGISIGEATIPLLYIFYVVLSIRLPAHEKTFWFGYLCKIDPLHDVFLEEIISQYCIGFNI